VTVENHISRLEQVLAEGFGRVQTCLGEHQGAYAELIAQVKTMRSDVDRLSAAIELHDSGPLLQRVEILERSLRATRRKLKADEKSRSKFFWLAVTSAGAAAWGIAGWVFDKFSAPLIGVKP
jgi:hypothetical protein